MPPSPWQLPSPPTDFLSVHRILLQKCIFHGSPAGLTSRLMWGSVEVTHMNEVPGSRVINGR